jgi:hypothetical protein
MRTRARRLGGRPGTARRGGLPPGPTHELAAT